jgi:hypothetical protein
MISGLTIRARLSPEPSDVMARPIVMAAWRTLAVTAALVCCLTGCAAGSHRESATGSTPASVNQIAPALPTPGATGASGPRWPLAPQAGGTRSAAELIPSTVRTATLDYTGPNPNTGHPARPAQHIALAGAELERLVSVLNSLPPLPPGTYSCASDDGERAVLTMAHRQFTMQLSGCRQVAVAVDGIAQPVLEGALADSLTQATNALLGQPAISGSRAPDRDSPRPST